MKYKVGDKVKLCNERPENWCQSGEMDKFLDKTVTIVRIIDSECFKILEDNEGWYFEFSDIIVCEKKESDQKLTAEDMADLTENKNHKELVELFWVLGYEKAKKNPYNEFCTAKEILDSGIKLEKDMKILVKYDYDSCDNEKRHFANISPEHIYAYSDGGTSWSTGFQTEWEYAKFVK